MSYPRTSPAPTSAKPRFELTGTRVALFASVPSIVVAVLWLTTDNDISLLQGAVAFALLLAAWVSYLEWRRRPTYALPIFAVIALAYWVYYSLPLFWGDRNGVGFAAAQGDVSPDSITDSMLLTALGVAGIALGLRSGLGRRMAPKRNPDIPTHKRRWTYLRALLLITTLAGLYQGFPSLLGEGARQVMVAIQKDVPTVVYVLLLRSWIKGEAADVDKFLIAFYLLVALMIGLASGWLGAFGIILVVSAFVYLVERHRLPRLLVAGAVVYVLFFQAGKDAVRSRFWYGGEEASNISKMEYWFEASEDKWLTALTSPSRESVRSLAYQSLSRLSLLQQTASVVELTPRVVPYQNGSLYSYMAVTLIPRLVWPDKPSVSEANQFYQVAYGLTTEDNLSSVSIAVGTMTESYINFGWFGVFGIMFLVGVVLDLFRSTFLTERSGLLFLSIGIALLPYLMTVEFQMAQYLGGLAQKVFAIIIVFAPLIKWRRRAVQAGSLNSGQGSVVQPGEPGNVPA